MHVNAGKINYSLILLVLYIIIVHYEFVIQLHNYQYFMTHNYFFYQTFCYINNTKHYYLMLSMDENVRNVRK